MTYYEEFGITSSATPDEIRHAHRRLMKILHPDLQIEEGTRQLAEIQSRRVNEIVQILLDFEHRKEYDASLMPISVPPKAMSRSYSVLGLGAAGLFCFCVGLWILQLDHWPTNSTQAMTDRRHQDQVADRQAMPPKTSVSGPITRKTEQPTPTAPSDSVPPDLPAIHVDHLDGETESAAGPGQAAKPAPLNRAEMEKSNPNAPSQASGNENSLIGTWIYVPAPIAKEDRKIYRPEYIEMRIRNIQGLLEGQYRARYHVPDRPLSPNVGFHFASKQVPGQPGTGSATFHWNGSNGLAGQVDLKLMTVNSIQVDWRVTELAESADLVSGTAILTRVQ